MSPPQTDKKLLQVLSKLEKTVDRMRPQKFLRSLWQNIVLGMAYSIGALLVVAIVVPLLLFFLQQIEWGPIFGRFFDHVIVNMEAVDTRR